MWALKSKRIYILYLLNIERNLTSITKNESTFSILPGDITHYVILRDGQERYRGDEESFTDVGGIRPFQEYSYHLRACNRAGCTDSPQVRLHVCLFLCY